MSMRYGSLKRFPRKTMEQLRNSTHRFSLPEWASFSRKGSNNNSDCNSAPGSASATPELPHRHNHNTAFSIGEDLEDAVNEEMDNIGVGDTATVSTSSANVADTVLMNLMSGGGSLDQQEGPSGVTVTATTADNEGGGGGGRGLPPEPEPPRTEFVIVQANETLERIAAGNDCTPSQLMKYNKLHSRMVFPGQKIKIPPVLPPPIPIQVALPCEVFGGVEEGLGVGGGLVSLGAEKSSDNIPIAPGTAIRTSGSQEEDLDKECLQKFLKLRVKQFTEDEGMVSGTLLVTPNCIMFDPDVTHPLVREYGSDPYVMVAPLTKIVSAGLFKDISALTGEGERIPGFDLEDEGAKKPRCHSSSSPSSTLKGLPMDEQPPELTFQEREIQSQVPMEANDLEGKSLSTPPGQGKLKFTLGMTDSGTVTQGTQQGDSSTITSEANSGNQDEEDISQLPIIAEEDLKGVGEGPSDSTVSRRHMSDSQSRRTRNNADSTEKLLLALEEDERVGNSCPSLDDEDDDEAFSDDTSNKRHIGKTKSNVFARPKLSGLRKSLSNRASSFSDGAKNVAGSFTTGAQKVGGAVTSGAQVMATGVATGTKAVGSGVVYGTKAAAATAVSGTKAAAAITVSSAKAVSDGAKAAADSALKMPQNIVNMGTGLFAPDGGILDIQDSWFADENSRQMAALSIKRQQSLAKLEVLKAKTAQYREEATHKYRFSCATAPDEKADLFKSIDELLPQVPPSLPELPYYFNLKLRKKRVSQRTSSGTTEDMYNFGNKTKTEFWFTVPRDKADTLYTFLIQWSHDKTSQELPEEDLDLDFLQERGFVVLDLEEEKELIGEPSDTPVTGSFLNREWEIVAVEEVRRRLSLTLSPGELPLPQGADSSKILTEPQVRQILEVLPARAESYPWVMVYCSDVHGFSLKTLYRKMGEWGEEMSPTLLVVKDTEGAVFGAIVSCPIRPAEHFFGTGDSCFLWTFHPTENELHVFHWTGENQFFVKASRDSLAVGSGGGSFGLWLDADLNHGRSRTCKTFDNPSIASTEDFILAQVEAYGFSMGV